KHCAINYLNFMYFKINQKKSKNIFFGLTALVFCQTGFAMAPESVTNEANIAYQSNLQQTITGTITDDTGIPLLGASVAIKGTSTGVTTDFDGNFIIEASRGDILQVTYVGFETQEVTIGDQTTLNIQMTENTSVLDEVVVVGYGTQRKGNLTGAVGSIDAEDIALRPSPDVTSALQGLIPGLNIQMNSGDPTAAPDINIRGFNSINGGSPLVLIDGIEGDITNLNPQDIESISVLKDAASAAIYGARGAFGV